MDQDAPPFIHLGACRRNKACSTQSRTAVSTDHPPSQRLTRTRWLIVCLAGWAAFVLPPGQVRAAVVINEFVAASSERRLVWNAEGVARPGSGLPWMDAAFNAAGWSNGL